MRILFKALLPVMIIAASCGNPSTVPFKPAGDAKVIPFRGNVFVTAAGGSSLFEEAPKVIDTYESTLKSWNDPQTVLSLFFRTEGKGTLHLAFQAVKPSGTEEHEFSFTCGGQSHKVKITASGTFDIGDFDVKEPGYVRVDIKGSSAKPDRAQFSRINRFYASGAALSGKLDYTPEDKGDDSYWSRRGPSVHLFYDFPEGDAEWFYNEATVPEEGSIPATYYMLTGFSEGYMGIQTHTDGPNTILLSVWSPYKTDNPGTIPEDMRVKTLRKGDGVTAQDFGGEGSGGQSFMTYPWKPGKTYGTLVHVRPDGKGNTDYTGYFRDEEGKWHLLASFRRPHTDTWYKGAYSFLECFDPNTGFLPRSVLFGNQWVRMTDGTWKEVTSARFSCDNTGRSGMRGDMYGASDGSRFLLKNCGFFNEKTEYGTVFTRTGGNPVPDIDLESLESL
ncbi:MAG: DUF3472 domain-containing protein [Bacteroidales bacterium]|nr:DUF3472 domain-containing protein [Bacteroidales bacterium]